MTYTAMKENARLRLRTIANVLDTLAELDTENKSLYLSAKRDVLHADLTLGFSEKEKEVEHHGNR